MVNWVNLDKLESFKELKNTKKVVLKDVMAGESGGVWFKNICKET